MKFSDLCCAIAICIARLWYGCRPSVCPYVTDVTDVLWLNSAR